MPALTAAEAAEWRDAGAIEESSMTRESLHRQIDELPEVDLPTATRVL